MFISIVSYDWFFFFYCVFSLTDNMDHFILLLQSIDLEFKCEIYCYKTFIIVAVIHFSYETESSDRNFEGKMYISCLSSKETFNVYVCVSRSVVSKSFQLHGLQPSRFLCPWDSPGENNGVNCHSFLQRIFLTLGSNSGFLHCRQILYHFSYREILFNVYG